MGLISAAPTLSAQTTLIKRGLRSSRYRRWPETAPAKHDLTEEKKMAAPPCPQPQDFSVLSGFITPANDTTAPDSFAGSITASVIDTSENETVRILESADPFRVLVEWCICGQLIQPVAGCWNVSLFLNRIDGIAGPSSGPLGTPQTTQVDSVPLQSVQPESFQRCYSLPFDFPGGTVVPGVYSLVAVITLSTISCANPGPLVGDLLGYAEIPVLVFFVD